MGAQKSSFHGPQLCSHPPACELALRWLLLVQDMPAFLRSELTIHISQRNKLLNHIMDVLARHTGGDTLGATS